MGALLADEPSPIIAGMALVAVSVGLILASVARARSRLAGARVVKIFWREVSQAGYLWAAATIVLLFGALGEVEGVRAPIWLVVAVVVGVIAAIVVRVRWLGSGLASASTTVDGPNRRDRPHVVSTSWEIALLGASVGALAAYGVTISHVWGHPIHWGIALIGGALGYSMGMVLTTPRYTVRAVGT